MRGGDVVSTTLRGLERLPFFSWLCLLVSRAPPSGLIASDGTLSGTRHRRDLRTGRQTQETGPRNEETLGAPHYSWHASIVKTSLRVRDILADLIDVRIRPVL